MFELLGIDVRVSAFAFWLRVLDRCGCALGVLAAVCILLVRIEHSCRVRKVILISLSVLLPHRVMKPTHALTCDNDHMDRSTKASLARSVHRFILIHDSSLLVRDCRTLLTHDSRYFRILFVSRSQTLLSIAASTSTSLIESERKAAPPRKTSFMEVKRMMDA